MRGDGDERRHLVKYVEGMLLGFGVRTWVCLLEKQLLDACLIFDA